MRADRGCRVKDKAEKFSSWAQTATHEVLMLQMNKTASLLDGMTQLSASQTVGSASLQSDAFNTRTSSVSVTAKPSSVETIIISSTVG